MNERTNEANANILSSRVGGRAMGAISSKREGGTYTPGPGFLFAPPSSISLCILSLAEEVRVLL